MTVEPVPGLVALGGEIDLTNCDREPIHIPGAILPHGAMLVLSPNGLEILQAAGDTLNLLGVSVQDLLGRNIDSIFGSMQIDRLRGLCAAADLIKPRHLLDPAFRVAPDRPLDASLHMVDDLLVLEFESADLTDRHSSDPLACVQEMLDGLDSAPSLQTFCQIAAGHVRNVTGYDRVMVYRFGEEGNGWVFAESKQNDLVPFLGLHYPASDIPVQARALYLKNWLRLITQVNYEPARLAPEINPRSGRPLDMSQATLRDVSPIHREYLRNMGVDASMSISIVCAGKLWGLFSCHNYTPRRLPRHLRAACELFGNMFSLQLETRERAEQLDARLASRQSLQNLMLNLAAEDDYAEGLVRQTPHFLDYIQAIGAGLREPPQGGLALTVNSAITRSGITPSDEQIAALTDWLTPRMAGNGIFATDRLAEIWPPAKAFTEVGSGLLALSVSREPHAFILWFRPEFVQSVTWAGDPTKPAEHGPHGNRLTPRKSFEVWKETVCGRANPWSVSDIDAVLDLRASLLEVVLRRIDAAARERERAHERERMVMAELDHRVKNTLANIQAIVSQTSRGAASLSDFVEGLDGRIRAMSKAHSLLANSRWEGASIRSIIADELAPYDRRGAIAGLTGPDVDLLPQSALALSLTIHELTTNAAKYGALSTSQGRVKVLWHLTGDGAIDLLWSEIGGPKVLPPQRRGFGSSLIERALAIETGGQATIHYEPDGVQCAIVLPASAIGSIGSSGFMSDDGIASGEIAIVPEEKIRRRILLVEDSSLILMLLEEVMDGIGWDVVGPATRVAPAMVLAREENIDAALLDVNLAGEMSWDIAKILKERGVPFIFSTGYDGGSVLPAELAGSPVLGKPFKIAEVESRLKELIAARAKL